MKCSLLTLSCYVDDELEERRRGEMEAHLVGCARCRSGLGHLREEVDRIGGLARVHVSDRSTHRLLVQLGMLEVDDPLPDRGAGPDPRQAALPPWLQGGAGGALPWSPERPRRAIPPPAPAPEPMELSGPPAAHRRLSALDGAAVPFDIAVLGGEIPVPLAPRPASPPALPLPPEERPAPSPAHPERTGVEARLDAQPSRPPGGSAPIAAAPEAPAAEAETAAAVDTVQPDAELIGSAGEAALPLGAALVASAGPGEQASHPAGLASLLEDPARRERFASGLTIDDRSIASSARAVGAAAGGAAAESETAIDPVAAAAASTDEPHTAADAVPSDVPPSPPGDTEVAVWTSDPADAPPGAVYPLTDEDVLDEPLPVERFGGGPIPAPRPRLVDRLRDRLATRRALAGGGPVGVDEGVELVSGTGAPAHARARSDLARRRAEALRPAAFEEVETVRREPGVREMLPPPARPSIGVPAGTATRHHDVDISGLDGRPLVPRRGDTGPLDSPPHDIAVGRPVTGTAVDWRPAPAAPVDDAGEVTGAAPLPRRRRAETTVPPRAATLRDPAPTAARDGRRTAIAYAAGVVLLAAVGFASARTVTRVPSTSASTTTAPQSIPVVPASSGGQSSASGSVSASAAPSAAPPAQAVAPAPSTVGTGGAGWTVSDIRVGDHGTYYRIVLDLAGGTGQPQTLVTYPDAQTILVTLTGSGGAAAAPGVSGALVKSITSSGGAGGSIAYRIALAKPGTAKATFVTGPLRLVVDVSPS